MSTKDQEKARKYRRDHYHRNKEQYYARNETKKIKLREYLAKIKSVPCMDCGVSYPTYVMDLDHRDRSTKLETPSRLVNCGSWAKMKEEIEKCDVVCSNCHRIRTFSSETVGV